MFRDAARRPRVGRAAILLSLLWLVMPLGAARAVSAPPPNVGPSCTPVAGDPCTRYSTSQDVPIVMDDGVTLESDVYTPIVHRRRPTVVIFTPYGKESFLSNETALNFPQHGYNEVVVDVRGTGVSGGYWDIFARREQKDYAKVIRWAAHRPFSDGHVVLAGSSYSAIAALLAAEQPGTRSISDLVIEVPMGDAYRDIFSAGGPPDSEFLGVWGVGLVGGEQLFEPAESAGHAPKVALNAESAHLYDVAKYTAPLLADSYLGSDQGAVPHLLPGQRVAVSYDGSFYRERSPLVNISRVRAPVFIFGAEHDIFQRTEPNLFDSLALPSHEKKLVMVPGYHTDAEVFNGATDSTGGAVPSVAKTQLAWSDHWALRKHNRVQSLPKIERYYYGRNRFVPERSEPLPHERYRRWYLDARASGTDGSLYDGSLVRHFKHPGAPEVPWNPFTGACSRNPVQYLYGVVPDKVDGHPNPCSTDERTNDHTAVTFTTRPFSHSYTEVGPMVAHLWMKASRPDTDVVAIVSDVRPNGVVDQVSYGSLIGSARALRRTRCRTPKVLDCSRYASPGRIIVPWHPFTKPAESKMQPGRGYPVDVEIFPSALTLRPGHRLRLSLLTGDFPHTVPTTSFMRSAIGGTTTFLFDARHRSWLYLGTPK